MKLFFTIIVAIGCLCTSLFFGAKRTMFLMSAEETTGTVESIDSENDRCGSRRNKHDCTEFTATVLFTAKDGQQARVAVSAGSARGHNMPISEASKPVGSSVPVLYDPKNPSEAFQNSFFDIWGIPVMSFFGSGIFFVSAFFQRRRR